MKTNENGGISAGGSDINGAKPKKRRWREQRVKNEDGR